MKDQTGLKDGSRCNWIVRANLAGFALFLLMFAVSGTASSGTGNVKISFSTESAVVDTGENSSPVGKTGEGGAAPAVARAGSIASDPLSQWRWRSPWPQPNALHSVAYGNNTFVAVGLSGAMLASRDGLSWSTGSAGKGAYIERVIYANNLFVGVGNGIYTSPDGITWKKRWTKSGAWLSAVSFGNNTFIAAGRETSCVTSSDGIKWTQGTGPRLNSLAYGNGVFVGTWYLTIFTSADGVVWTSHPGSAQAGGVVYGRGLFVTTLNDEIFTSSDGVSWGNPSVIPSNHLPYHVRTVLFCNDFFMASWWDVWGSSGIITSTDGVTWSFDTGTISGLHSFPSAVACGNDLFVAVGGDGTFDHCIYTSPDGLAWTERSISVKANVMAYGGGTFVGVAGQTSITSSDGIEWTEHQTGTTLDRVYAMAYGNGTFAGVGGSGVILTSPDGISWTARSSGTAQALRAITYAKNKFVAVGDYGTIVTSPTGETWTAATVPLDELQGVAYSGEKFVAVGYDALAVSSDGVTWTAYTTSPFVNFTALAFGKGMFTASMVTGDYANSFYMATSVDGLHWEATPAPNWSRIRGILYESGAFVAVGDNWYDSTPLILTSSDGASWRRRTLPAPTNGRFNSLAFGRGTFVTAGTAIVQSGNLCTYAVPHIGKKFLSDGGTTLVTITASDADCPAPAVSASAGWITWADPVFNGSDGTLQVNAAANPSSSDRKGWLSIDAASLSMTQAGQLCAMGSLAPPSATYDKAGGTGQLALTVTPSDCQWTARPQGAAWIKITEGASGSGGGTISYTVKPNAGKKDRTANVKVTLKKGGTSQTSAIHQEGQ